MLFVIAADLLQTLINDLLQQGLIIMPLPTHDPDFPVIQYADDTLLFLNAERGELEALKLVLYYFSEATGLQINFHKSSMCPINVNDHAATDLAALFGCKLGKIPFTYLGLPMSTSKPRIEDFVPLLKRIENGLLGCSTLLSSGDKLTLIKSVFTSMPTFFMSTLMIPKTVIKQINSYLMNCFWRKFGTQER